MDADPPPAAPRVPFAHDAAPDDGPPRQRLARWITSPDNPFFARAIANRMWTLMLGRSLSRAGVDDIEGPERLPGALAVLAEDFVAHGYDLRRLIRLIAGSRAFQVAGAGAASREAADVFAAFPMVQLRAEQIAASLVQIASLPTVDAESHILWRLIRLGNERDFVRRYGDAGEDELREHPGTLMQRLTMMNGRIVRERTQANLFNAGGRIAALSPDDETRVRVAFLVCLTREPGVDELAHFTARLAGKRGEARQRAVEDMMWALINSSGFSWSH